MHTERGRGGEGIERWRVERREGEREGWRVGGREGGREGGIVGGVEVFK